jgi:hypothetical protein
MQQQIIGCSIPISHSGNNVLIMADNPEILKSFLGDKFPEDLVPLETGIILGREWVAEAEELPVVDHLMACKKFAEELDGIEYDDEIERHISDAKEKGFLIIAGASDDLTEFYGAWRDDSGHGEIIIDANGILPSVDEIRDSDEADDIVAWGVRRKAAKTIRAKFGENGHEFDMGDIPHATFEMLDGKELFATCVVLHISSL